MELTLVGIGTGNPDHLTLQAVEAIRTADLLLIPDKGEGKQELANLRRRIVAINGGAGHVAFGQPHDLPALQIDCRKHDHRGCA